jgi:hypothetical protein
VLVQIDGQRGRLQDMIFLSPSDLILSPPPGQHFPHDLP